MKAYIKRFAHVAESEQLKYKIPASITLANAMLQSQAGQQNLARVHHNHFGLLCTSDWIGEQTEQEGTVTECMKTPGPASGIISLS